MRSKPFVLLAALAATVAVPTLAQIRLSDSLTFLKAVRDRDGAKAQDILNNPSTTALNARDERTGEGALHILARGRDLTWLNFMLTRGARPDLEANDGTTALHLAAQLGWVEGAQALLARRASVNKGNRRGETALMLAVQARDVAMIRLLLNQGANPNQTDNAAGLSALDYARRDPRAEAIVRLLQETPQQRREVMGPSR